MPKFSVAEGLVNLVTHKAKLFQEKHLEHLIYLVAHLLTPFIFFYCEPSPNTALLVLQLRFKLKGLGLLSLKRRQLT